MTIFVEKVLIAAVLPTIAYFHCGLQVADVGSCVQHQQMADLPVVVVYVGSNAILASLCESPFPQFGCDFHKASCSWATYVSITKCLHWEL